MNNTRDFRRLAACGFAAALIGMAPALQADQNKPPYPDSPGWMGGYGMGHGMGPGMMGSYGMGHGMMGGYGMGPGMMGPYWGSGLDLTDAQQAKVNKIQDETRKLHWSLMNEMMEQQAKLRDLYQAPKRDSAAIDKAYKEYGKLQQRMYDTGVEAQTRMESVLTREQQERLRTYWRKGWEPRK